MIGSEKVSISAQELAASSNSEELLVVRVMRVLVAEGYAANEGARRYTPTALSAALTDPAIEACVVHSFDVTARVQSFLPEYFQQHGYHSPVHPKNGPFQYAFGTDLSFFEFLHSQPKRAQTFNTYMAGNRSDRQHWLDWFPFHENVLRTWEERNDSKEMLLVDMGGGKGHDLKRLLEKYPEAKGRLVLEDLPGALQDFEDHGCSIATYAHDIFTPQPVKGAAVYYTHFLLHDFPDQMCIEMLRQTDQAMGTHSCILLNEIMLPETDCPPFFAAADITMMSNLSALARSKDQWKTLVHAAGLVIRKIWMSPDLRDWEVVIEIGRRSSDS
ncbi:O-methyltransferase-like protein 3 [Elsinoe australis]|uniref:O-methyltransferase-like protein 3 n=1 Tax=Elsinoe australis TaxID=40998 RepID=A0A4U7B9E6_9PEZI|nr:O-methyltransferase-like protein 3 [Elsinoe australis]